jgi:hypothetical protein
MKIRFAGYNPPGGGSLTNFPALVTFRNGSNAFHYADMASPSDAADLRFATATGADELTYEVDRWDTGGVSTVWVRTDLAGTNDCLWAYWGKSGATLPPYTTNGTTWSAGYRCVWHLGESPADAAPQLQDRTATRLHASCLGGMVAGDQVAGQIGGALRFDGTARYAETATNDLLDSDQAGTVSAWVKTVANGVILAYGNCQVQSNAQWIFEIYTGALRVAWSANPQGKNASVAGRIPVANGVWHHVAASADGVNPIALYVDGVADTTTFRLNAGDPGATNWDWIADCYGIAARSNYVDLAGLRWQPSGFYGRLAATVDEVRVSSVVRSSNWVWACWLNQASNRVFADYANAQSAPDVNNAGGASDLQATSATLNASLAAGSSAHGYLYCWTNGAPLTNAYDMGTVFEPTFRAWRAGFAGHFRGVNLAPRTAPRSCP